MMINRALERNYATFVRLAVSMDDTINLSTDYNKSNFIEKFHQNTVLTPNDDNTRNMMAGRVLEDFTILNKENLKEFFDDLNNFRIH